MTIVNVEHGKNGYSSVVVYDKVNGYTRWLFRLLPPYKSLKRFIDIYITNDYGLQGEELHVFFQELRKLLIPIVEPSFVFIKDYWEFYDCEPETEEVFIEA